MNKQVADLDNVHIIYQDIDTYSDYLKYYYKCDNHWNGFGAIMAYNLVAESLGLPSTNARFSENDILKNYSFYGQLGRQGRMLLANTGPLDEPPIKAESLEVSNAIADAAILSVNLSSIEPTYAEYNFYQWFYGGDIPAVITNENLQNGESLLVICDSFGDAFRWAAASSCKEVNSVYDLHGSSNDYTSFSERIEETSAKKLFSQEAS